MWKGVLGAPWKVIPYHAALRVAYVQLCYFRSSLLGGSDLEK